MSVGFVRARDGLRIAYEECGESDLPLVFVHGWSCNRSYWTDQLHAFAPEFKVVALDLAGHGDSDRTRGRWTIDDFGGDVATVVEQLELANPILVGHSMGGDVVVAAALQLGGRVAGLIWVDTYKQLGTPRTPEQLRDFFAPFRVDFASATRAFVRKMFAPGADEALVTRIVGQMASAPPQIALPALQAALSFDSAIPAALQRLGLTVIAINPEVPPTDRSSMERYGVFTLTIPGVAHFPMLEKPEEFNAMLKAAIARIRSRERS